MAPRTLDRALASSSTTPVPVRGASAIAKPASSTAPQLRELRRQWKWAAFSQFFHTFSQLIALEDITLVDIEDDLTNSTMVVLPRLMQRLLVTLTQDRKISLENWQSALRKQYMKKDPNANPIGVDVEAPRYSRATTTDIEPKEENVVDVKPLQDVYPSEDLPEAIKNEPMQDTVEMDVNGRVSSSPVLQDGMDGTELTPETSRVKDWADLPMLEKVESMHVLAEWHFQVPLRLRSLMRSDDEYASWRVEPIGYDSKKNAYWLIGSDRLWIQRVLPRPSKKSLKRKTSKSPRKGNSKNPRIDASIEEDVISDSARTISAKRVSTNRELRGRAKIESYSTKRVDLTEAGMQSDHGGGSRSRAAKTKANVRLDLQAKQLAAAKAEMEAFSRRASTRTSPSKAKNTGTRKSRRLHANESDDEWQQIPPEWLLDGTDSDAGTSIKPTRRRATVRQIESSSPTKTSRIHYASFDSDESELTELSDDELSLKESKGKLSAHATADDKAAPAHNEQRSFEPVPIPIPPADFIEWETICVSLQEWECVAEPFARSTNYLEKALYKVLVNNIIPPVTEALRELEKQRNREEALMNRKRSSRLAIRDSEKEAARLAAEKQAEEEEKVARLRRIEARARREEEDRLKRENEREKRRLEREERERARSRRVEENETKSRSTAEANDLLPQDISVKVASRSDKTPKEATEHGKPGDDWELDCEICGATGINKDDGSPLMCCGRCSVWQHIKCHDSVDKRAGRPPRNWESVEFTCSRCRAQDARQLDGNKHASQNSHFDPAGRIPLARFSGYGTYLHSPHPSLNFNRFERDSLAKPDMHLPPTTARMPEYDANQTQPRFTYYQPTERSYAQHPVSVKAFDYHQPVPPAVSTQVEMLPNQRAANASGYQSSNDSAQSPEPSKTLAAPYISYVYPKNSNAYPTSHPANLQLTHMQQQQQPLTSQAFSHPHA